MKTKNRRLVDCCRKVVTGVKSAITIVMVDFSKPAHLKAAVADLPATLKLTKRARMRQRDPSSLEFSPWMPRLAGGTASQSMTTKTATSSPS